VDTKIINVYNEKNQKLVGSGLIIVDAATEPLKVLKVLVEGLPDGRSGLWLTNFKGIPVARTLSPFDLVYLDPSYQVVHCVEISVEGEYEPFRGDPASALVLPPKSISSSRMLPGDRLQFRTADPNRMPASGPRPSHAALKPPTLQPAPDQPAHFYNSSFPVRQPDDMGNSLPGFLGGMPPGGPNPPSPTPGATASAEPGPSAQAASGRLTKSAKSLLGASPAFHPSLGDEPQPGPQGVGMGAVSTMQTSPPPVEMAFSVRMPTRLMATPMELGAVTDQPAEAQPTTSMHSGRLLRTVNLAPAILPEEEPEIAPPATETEPVPAPAELTAASPLAAEAAAAASPAPEMAPAKEKSREPAHGIVIPFAAPASAAAHYAAPAVHDTPAPVTVIPIAPEPAASTALVPLEPRPAAQAAASQERLATAAQPMQAPVEPAAGDAALPVAPPSYPRTQIKRAETQDALAVSPKKKTLSWDVRLLYKLFPEFDPARPPEIRFPRMDEKREPELEDEEQLSMKLRFLCWLYPDLHLDKVKEKRSEERRAVRLPAPGLVAYFFTGGAPRPHPIKDISVTGFYMITNERWLPGTIVRVTLQMIDARAEGGRDSVTVHSRVVRWGPDGGGFEFVLPGFLQQ